MRLRPPERSDLEALSTIWGDPDVVEHVGGKTRDRQDTWFTLLRNRGMWGILGYGYWVAVDRGSGEVLGEVGFADFERGMVPDISGCPEAGWVFAKTAWGRGIATEAVAAAHDWLDRAGHGHSVCIIDPGNAASIAVAEKNGYREIRASEYRDAPVIVFERRSIIDN